MTEEAQRLVPTKNCRAVAIYGGQRVRRPARGLKKGCAMVVGTPGRLLDHLSRGTITLDRVKYVVLDEADRMLDIGFRPDIEKILRRCPGTRQTLLLSATLPPPVLRLAKRYMVDPLHINLSPAKVTVENIRQTYITVDEDSQVRPAAQGARPRAAPAVHHLLRAETLGGRCLQPAASRAQASGGDARRSGRNRSASGS